MNLFGNVSYEEPGKMRIQSERATYFTREERLFADGNVVATQLSSGSTFRGSSIEYLRAIAGSRPVSKVIAPNRPTVQLIEKDSTGKPGPPISITANTMVDEGDTMLFAWGEVQINRTTLQGESDSASFDKTTERARLIRTARIINRDQAEPFRLFGDTIDLYSKEQKLEAGRRAAQCERVERRCGDAGGADRPAVHPAEAGARVRLRQRAGQGHYVEPDAGGRFHRRANARAAGARGPRRRARRGDRRARHAQDQVRKTAMVLRGDTVIAWFDSTSSPSDTTGRARIEAIRASGNASSLFQIASKQGPAAPAALNYVRGKTIRLAFDSGQVRMSR